MIRRRRGAALIALTAAALALGLAGCGDDDDGDAVSATSIGFSQIADSGISGEVDLTQDGNRVSGYIEMSGLEPGSAHAVHIHGITGEDFGCSEDERTTNHMIDLPDLVADEDGEARLEVDVEGPADAVRLGTYVMVHENPGTQGGADGGHGGEEGTGHDSDGDAGHDESEGGGHDGDADETATIGGAAVTLVHNGEDHGSPEEAEAHKAGDNPPIACAEFEGGES